jgi:ABC-type nickel/cobalt efflux system permease component RcnA
VHVDYRLEVDEFTALYEDLLGLGQNIDLSKLRSAGDFHDLYAKTYAPILAGNLRASLDGRPLQFACVRRNQGVRDEQGQPLGHLRCDFVFEAQPVDAELGNQAIHRLSFREGNFEFEDGLIRLSVSADQSVDVVMQTQADEALKGRPATQWKPGDEEKLRSATVEFRPAEASLASRGTVHDFPAASVENKEAAEEHTLLSLLLDSQRGCWALLTLAALFGAAHALTPGHGKTLVAAYLIGERGTVGHAFLLGLVTTLTHTGAVFVLAVLLLFLFPHAVPRDIQMTLGLVGGLLIAGMGLWLLLRRLSGGADHFHVGSHGHHHHHHHHYDHHHEAIAAPLERPQASLGWWGLVGLGVSGGIVPCWDAILMLGFAISAQRLWLGIPLLLAFSAGLAGVLIAIGIGVVYLKGFAASRWHQSRLIRALPLVSAILVTGMGIWLCYDSTRTAAAAAPSGLTSSTLP